MSTAWLALAQADGRIGFWRLDAGSGQVEADAAAQALWGFGANSGPLTVEHLRAQLADADRAAFDAALHDPAGSSRAMHCTVGRPPQPARAVLLRLCATDAPTPQLHGTITAVAAIAAADGPAPGGGAEPLLALAADLGDIALWRHDLLTDRMHYDAQACRVLGIAPRPEGLTKEEVRALIHPEDLPRVVASATAALHSTQPTDIEARYRRAGGGWRDVMTRRVVQRDAAGRPFAVFGVAIDITERHSAEHALAAERERVALATRAAGIGTWEFDPASGREIWDEQMWRLRGHVPREQPMSPQERLACVHPDDRHRLRALLARGRRDLEPLDIEFRVVWPDGQVRWLASRSIARPDAAGGALHSIGVNWDITDRRSAEAAWRERELALSESRAKSKFLARMSHELRTPLNAVLGFAQLLLAEEGAPDPAAAQRRRRLEHVRAAGQQLLALVDDVLDLARVEGGELRLAAQPVALAPLVADTLPLLQPLAQARRLQLRTGELGHTVRADATRLRQVLLNLLGSAARSHCEGSTIDIDSRFASPSAGEPAACVVLRVAGSSRGMSEAQPRHLFQPAERTPADGAGADGAGIATAVAKALLERMGGSLEVHSQAGAGCSFELRLPAVGGSEMVAAASGAAPAARSHRLLYIEDNPINALIIRELVAGRADLELEVAPDGTSGVARAREWQPGLVLLDMQLPDFDGFEVLRRLRAAPETAATTVIALSANAMPADIRRALDAGMSDYWTKPLDFRAFMVNLELLFGRPPA